VQLNVVGALGGTNLASAGATTTVLAAAMQDGAVRRIDLGRILLDQLTTFLGNAAGGLLQHLVHMGVGKSCKWMKY